MARIGDQAAPAAAAGVERAVDGPALRGPFDHVVVRAVRDAERRVVVADAVGGVEAMVLPSPDAGPGTALDGRGPAGGRIQNDGQVQRAGTPLGRRVVAPVDAAAVARRGIVGHRLAGEGGGEHVGIAQGQGERAAAAHALAVDVDPVGIDGRPRRLALQVADHPQHALFRVVHDHVAGGNLAARAEVVVAGESEPPGLALVDGIDAIGAPAPRIGILGDRPVRVAAPAVEDQRGGRGLGAAIRREHRVVVDVGQRVPHRRRIGIQPVVAVARIRRVEGGIPFPQIHELQVNPAARADGLRRFHGQRFRNALSHRPQRVARGEIGPVFGAGAAHGGHRVVGGAGGAAGEVVGGQRPRQQAGAGRQRRSPVRDDDAVEVARLERGVDVAVGGKIGGTFPDLVEPRGRGEVARGDRLRVAVDAVGLAGEIRAFAPGQECLARPVEGPEIRRLGRTGSRRRERIGGKQHRAGVGRQGQVRGGDGGKRAAVAAAGIHDAAAAGHRAPAGRAQVRNVHRRVGRIHQHDAVGITAPIDAPRRMPQRGGAGGHRAGRAAQIDFVFGIVFQRHVVRRQQIQVGFGSLDEQVAGRGEHPLLPAGRPRIRLADRDLVAARQRQRAVHLQRPVGGIEIAVRTPERETFDHAAVAEAIVHVHPRGDERAEIRQEDEIVRGQSGARGAAELLQARNPVCAAQIHVFQPRMRRTALAEPVGVWGEAVGEHAVVLGRADAGQAVADPIGGKSGNG